MLNVLFLFYTGSGPPVNGAVTVAAIDPDQ
jgi:hypothetical protein